MKLHVDSVTKSYGYDRILSDIYLSCEPGQIVGLIGRNGSGKSTLLKIVFGAIPSEYKFVKVGNRLIKNIVDSKGLIKYLPQHNFLPDHIRIKNLIDIYCEKKSIVEVKSLKLIKPKLNNFTHQLSGGERRLLEIIISIFGKARFVLLDEPFNGVAPLQKSMIKKLMQEQCKEKGFIITDHDYRNVFELSTRMILIRDGKTIAISDPKELVAWGYISN